MPTALVMEVIRLLPQKPIVLQS